MKVIVIKFEEKLTPMVVSEKDTVEELKNQWKSTENIKGEVILRTVDRNIVTGDTLIADLPLPQVGYSSIELLAERVVHEKYQNVVMRNWLKTCKLDICMGSTTFALQIPLTHTIDQLTVACCKELNCNTREMIFYKDDSTLEKDDQTLHEFGIKDGDTLNCQTVYHITLTRVGFGRGEEVMQTVQALGSDKLSKLFDDNDDKKTQRLYKDEIKLDPDKTVTEAFGVTDGFSKETSIPLLHIKQITIQVKKITSDDPNPTKMLVNVWPNKALSCVLKKQKANMMLWRDEELLNSDSTFSNNNLTNGDVLIMDTRVILNIKLTNDNLKPVHLKSSATLLDLMKCVRKLEENVYFLLYFEETLLTGDSCRLREFGIYHEAEIDVKIQTVPVTLHYEGTNYKAGSFTVGCPFGSILSEVEKILDCSLPANTVLECNCGRKVSQDEEYQCSQLPINCCDANPRRLTVHRLLDIKVTDFMDNSTRHVRVDSTGTVKDILIELEAFNSCRLLSEGKELSLDFPLRQLYKNNRMAVTLEKMITLLVVFNDNPHVKCVWPSDSLASIVRNLTGEKKEKNTRIEVRFNDKLLASYGMKIVSCKKQLMDYDIVDGSVLQIETKGMETVAEFRIICNQWGVSDFEVSLPIPVKRMDVYDVVMEKFDPFREPGEEPVLAQLEARNEKGERIMYTTTNLWVTMIGEETTMSQPAKFVPLEEYVDYVPKFRTKIFLRRWLNCL